ncbi:hypothetical protein HELRODRAFT_113500, partial [Helobdella robusta]|uniref:DNA helicase n=1 Tax=Helobdella robusta TaxID=6412 RepID=T1EFT0_HELRO
MSCLHPPMKNLPEGDWKCPICVMNPPKAKVKQVLTWRWKHQPKDADELDHTHSPQKQPARNEKELFVKFEYHSYWDCSWIAEIELEVHQPITHCNFKRKFDMNEPPALEDGSSFGRPRHKNASSEDDPHNLEERFYRYGIKPEWLQIHRIITHELNKDRRYLVKWKDLPYSECTWEYPGELPKGLEGFEKYIEIYWDRRFVMITKQKLAKDDRKFEPPKKSLLRKKLEKQAPYFDECGGNLHPYQLEGLNWLRFSWSQGTNTILADEMGLGKTVQAIAFLYTLYKEGYITNKPFLVSAPLSTVPNWEREFEFWAPELYVVTYTGVKENRVVLREQEFSYKEGAFASTSKPCKLKDGHKPKFDVLLTSYEFIHMDFTTLSSIEWGVLIIDEAHRLKNNQSLFFRTMADYKINYKLLLTGTPLQNNLEELFNLLHFLEPEKFANMDEFLSEFSEISKDEQVLKLHELLAPHMLRRMKMDVLKDIPSKSEFIVRIELSAMQKKYYKHILTKNYEALNAKGYSNQTSLINIMMDLRKCCNHPYLFPGAEKDAPLTMMGMYEGTSMTKASGKLEMLDKMLKRLKRDGHRVLIFSQMTRMLDIMEDFLTAFNYGYERIDGSISGNKRQESIDRFNSPESSNFVFLLSTRAGGLGINLATADTVIIYDMDWNPHNDIQAFSRAHRIGQKNKVMIYRFVTRNTVEEKIAQVCKQKMMLSELIVHRGMGGGSLQTSEKTDSLTKQEISDILKYGAENLFRDDEEGQVVYSDEAIEKLLDRSIETVVEKEKEFGMNEYLRSFKVASYQVKEGVDDEEENEDNADNNDDSSQQTGADDRMDAETDMQYWQRVLGPAYNEHMIQTLKEQEELANKLGKGKRIRKHINYAEKEMMDAAEALSKVEARKRIVMEEDVTFQSDYEPSSTSDEEGGSGKEEDGSE